jgi:uncharacterized phage protein gp47/JayE
MAKKTFDEIVQSMRDYILAHRPQVNTEEGSVTRDLFIEPPADEIQNIYIENERIKLIHSLYYQAFMTVDEMDMLGFNYNITRKPATAASGIVTLYRSALQTQDIVIPAGSVFSTQKDANLNSYSFSNDEDVTMYLAQAATYYNTTTGYYEIEVGVTSTTTGAATNVGVNSIRIISSGTTDFLGVKNDAVLTGGTDSETNFAYSQRIADAVAGNSVGTEFGYKRAVMTSTLVNDATVITPGDALMTRDNGYGGKVDIYIKADIANVAAYSSVQDVYVFNDLSSGVGANSVFNDHTFDHRPAKLVTSVSGSISGNLSAGVDYQFSKDTTSVYADSNLANDKIHYLKTNVPVFGETITIVYQYYNIIDDINDILDTERQKIITADVLVKLAKQVPVNVSVTVYADDTISDSVTFTDAITTAIEESLDSDLLGNKIEQSDLVQAIYEVVGVDRVNLPFTVLNAPSKAAYTAGPYNLIQLDANEFSWFGTISVTVVLVA